MAAIRSMSPDWKASVNLVTQENRQGGRASKSLIPLEIERAAEYFSTPAK
jgi:hypothetical protein